MKVAVTGATGLVGSEICSLLSQNNIEILALTRKDPRQVSHPINQYPLQKIDYKCLEDLKSTLQKMDAIVHCAAKIGDWGPEKEYIEENCLLLNNILNVTHQNQKIIFLSSQGVYSFGDHYGTNEDSVIARRGIDGYTQSKIETEKICKEHQVKGRNISILRPGFIYGSGDQHLIPNVVEALKKKRVVFFGSGKEVLNLTDVKLISQACLSILSSPNRFKENSCFNIRDEAEISKIEFFSSVAKQLDIPFQPKFLTKPLGLMLCNILDQTGRWLDLKKAPILTKAKFKFLGNNLSFSIEKMQNELGVKGGDFRSFKI